MNRISDHHFKLHLSPPAYNIVLAGWSKSGDYNLATNAENLLKEMETSAKGNSSRIAPNKYTYNCIVFCYTWSNLENKGEMALAVLEKMKGMAETNPYCRPDCTTYNAVMNCITKTNHPSAPYKVEALLEEMIEIHKVTGNPSMKPSNRSFNACVSLTFKRCGKTCHYICAVAENNQTRSRLVSLHAIGLTPFSLFVCRLMLGPGQSQEKLQNAS